MTADRKPPRVIGLPGAVLLNLNGVVGAGIFALPALLYAGAGSYAPLAIFAFAALVAADLSIVAKISTKFNQSGGPQLYIEQAFGRFAGFLAGWCILGANLAARAANFHVMVSYLAAIFPIFDQPVIRMATILALIVLFTLLAISGTRRSIGALWVGTALKIGPILLLCVVGLAVNGLPGEFAPPQFSEIEATALLLAYAFSGGAVSSISAGETRNAQRTVLWSMYINIAIIAALYTLVQLAFVAIAPDAANVDRPLASAADTVFGPWGGVMIALAAIFSIGSGQLTYFVAMPRLIYAMGRRGLLPAKCASLSRFETPWFAISVYGLVAAALAISGTFQTLANMLVAAESLVSLGVFATFIAMWRRSTGGIAKELGFGWGVITVIAGAFTLWMMAQLPLNAALPTLGMLLVGGAVFLIAHRNGRDIEAVEVRPA
ncbi:APC family permease [Aurantiacibacter rhizosphaerae]|uniref:Amino acid permease n=1 Tax=Aurantiacibacter rhizosphaerae TaxID=2691582 RepID=A0A844XE46_9SPHN|nr:APC family permease [Aurantiacibacter rhizosphaerae]MWV28831.1 amino acid permease [Aurantiacibacter rhizosphaerae]